MSTPQPERPPPDEIPPGTEACGCCEGIATATAMEIDNRAGLSQIAYRIGTYEEFLSSLHAGLSSAGLPRLAQLRTRDQDDFTIALLDAVACTADVLTFYQERIANESYLATAVERLSLEEMGRLTGYRLRPGAAAETWLAISLETPPVPPEGAGVEPGTFVTGVPAEVTIESGLAVRSVPGPNEKPQVFETVEAVKARAPWNAMRPWLASPRRPTSGATFTYFAGVRTNLKPGDAVLFLGPDSQGTKIGSQWAMRILSSVEVQAKQDRTFVTWHKALPGIGDALDVRIQAWALRRHVAVYGHNAPAWGAMTTSFQNKYNAAFPETGGGVTEWPRFRISPLGATSTGGWIDLDAVYAELNLRGLIVLMRESVTHIDVLASASPSLAGPAPIAAMPLAASVPSAAASSAPAAASFGASITGATALKTSVRMDLFRIDEVREASREEFALSGKVTRLHLVGPEYGAYLAGVRQTSVFAGSEPLAFAPYPVDEDIIGSEIAVEESAETLEAGRVLLVRGTRARDAQEITSKFTLVAARAVAPGARPRTVLEIDPPIPEALVRASVIVYGNVAQATHGETVAQVLGSGNASEPFQRFDLKQLPLTFRSARNELGATAQLTVRVNDVQWRERDSMFDAGPQDRAFTLLGDEQGRQFVQFGDGERGARLPTGTNNVRARYRKGLGAAGNVSADTLTQPSVRPLGLKGVSNPIHAEGGTDPESAARARTSMPLGTRTLGRAVSLLDYEDFARAFTGVTKAQARVLTLPFGPTIAITIAGQDNTTITAASPIWQSLQDELLANGDPHVMVRLLSHRSSAFQLGLKVKRHPDYDRDTVLAAVEAALRAQFGFDARELGQAVQQSAVVAAVHEVPGVVAVDLDFLYGGTEPVIQTQPPRHERLLAAQASVKDGIALAAELLTLDPGPLVRLEEMQ